MNAGCADADHRAGKFKKACYEIFLKASAPHLLGNDFDPDCRYLDQCSGNGTMAFAQSICPSSTPDNIDIRTYNYLKQAHVARSLGAKIDFGAQEKYFDYTADALSLIHI